MKQKRAILIAGLGISPAVLTCTVWALAHQRKPVIPDEIVILCTKTGRDKLLSVVFSGKNSIWERMLRAMAKEGLDIEGKLVCGEASIRVLADHNHNLADDLRCGEDNLSAADTMLGEVRKYTSDPDTVVYASIAGGRKTMSALLFSCMSLLGREDDKILHVLNPPEYEGRLDPVFYFPEKGLVHKIIGTTKKVQSVRVGIELFEVPFVRVRGWFQEKFKSLPPSYRALVEKVQEIAPRAVSYPDVCVDVGKGVLIIGHKECHPGLNEFAALVLFASGISNPHDIYERLYRLRGQHGVEKIDWLERFKNSVKFAESLDSSRDGFDPKLAVQDVAKVASQLRKYLIREGLETAEMLVPQRGRPVTFSIERIEWKGREAIEKACGYLFNAKASLKG